jgi:enoyl-CoA hydratase
MADVLSEVRGAAMHITINRPDHGNSITDPMAQQLTELFTVAGKRAKFVVLTGSGAGFCFGRAPGPLPAGPVEALEQRASDVAFDCYGSVRTCPVPVVGVVRGHAHVFGCALAALCDITFADSAATFQIPEITNNTMPTMVMSSLIGRMSAKTAGYLVYTAAIISAERALTFGIVSNVVRADALDQEVASVCNSLMQAPRAALEGNIFGRRAK